jgi:hypothetical protein
MQIDHAHASSPPPAPTGSPPDDQPGIRPAEDPVPVGALIGDVLARLRAAFGAESDPAEPIVVSARELYDDDATRAALARGASYRSVDPTILASPPGRTKTSVFAGDVLTLAGFAAPTHEVRGWDGSIGREYRDAGRWPREAAYFTLVSDLWQVRPGDLVVIHPADGRAQVEVVTDVAFTAGGPVILTMGARERGLEEDFMYGDGLCAAARSGDGFLLRAPGGPDVPVHVLRARMPLAARGLPPPRSG